MYGRRIRFSIAAALGAMALVAFLAVEAREPSWQWAKPFITVGLIELVAAIACVEALVCNIPVALAKAQYRNCRTRNGRWSASREKAEAASLKVLRWELQKACLLVALGTNALLIVFHYQELPHFEVAGGFWLLCVCGFVSFSYYDGLKQLASSIEFRAQQYRLVDLHAQAGAATAEVVTSPVQSLAERKQ